MSKPSSEKKNPVLWYSIAGGKDNRVQIFPKGIRPKLNLIPLLELEFAYNNVEVPVV